MKPRAQRQRPAQVAPRPGKSGVKVRATAIMTALRPRDLRSSKDVSAALSKISLGHMHCRFHHVLEPREIHILCVIAAERIPTNRYVVGGPLLKGQV